MKIPSAFLLLIAGMICLTGCTALRQLDSGEQEQLLAAAGFRQILAITPKRAETLKSLPPYKLQATTRNGRRVYVYADPKDQVLYVGGVREYDRYQKLAVQQQIADENLMSAEMQQEDTMNWDAWGPLWW